MVDDVRTTVAEAVQRGVAVSFAYRAPDAQSFRDAAWVDEALATPTGLFNPVAVQKLARKARSGSMTGFRDNAAFVGILSTQLWHQAFPQRQSALNFAA